MANTYLFWDGYFAPDGWSIVSAIGGAFYHKFVRGAASYGGTGGADTHTHIASLAECGPATGTPERAAGTTNNATPTEHAHTVTSKTFTYETNLPAYRSLKVIQYAGVPTTLPSGIIALFDAAVPASFDRYSAADGKFIYGSDAVTDTGSDAHTHTIEGNLSTVSPTLVANSGVYITVESHNHTFNGVTGSHDNVPSYITSIIGKANSDLDAIPVGVIAMFDDTPSGGWQIISGPGDPLNGYFIRGSGTYGTTGGSNTHSPSDFIVYSDASSGHYKLAGWGVGVAAIRHHHYLTFTLSKATNTPPYIDVIFAKYMGEPAPVPAPFCDVPRFVAAGML